MKIFCPVWGDKHISLLSSALGRCLSWPKNNQAVRDAQWVITCENISELTRISKIVNEISGQRPIRGYYIPGISAPNVDTGQALIYTVREAIRSCITDDEPLLMATPDFIFGEGTIDAFKAIASDPGSCATIAHIRVLPDALNEIKGVPSNPELMSLAWRYAHTSWIHSDAAKKPGMTHKGGVRWWGLGDSLKAVQHFMPSPFYVNFLEKDLTSFNQHHEGKPPGFGMWDHVWPSELLQDGRLRFIGSSDAAMMIEVTDSDKNVPPFNERSDPAGFFRDHFHNRIQKQFISIFRGL